MSVLKKHRLLNDLIGVYKKNFQVEKAHDLPDEQKELAKKIQQLSSDVQRNYSQSVHFRNGLTSIKFKSSVLC